MPIYDGHRERMRKQLKISGMDSLSDVQVLEVMLYYAIARQDTNCIAHRLLQRFGSLSAVIEAPKAELMEVEGVGEKAADLIGLFMQVERRHMINRAGEEVILDTTGKCAQYLLPFFIGEQEEVVYLLCMDAKCKVLDCRLIHRGAVNTAAISVRRVVKAALERNATSVVVSHNHPSGIALASAEDKQTTLQLKTALDAVGVVLADHIIVADGDYISLAADGVL